MITIMITVMITVMITAMITIMIAIMITIIITISSFKWFKLVNLDFNIMNLTREFIVMRKN